MYGTKYEGVVKWEQCFARTCASRGGYKFPRGVDEYAGQYIALKGGRGGGRK